MLIYIYGSDTFKKEIHSVLNHSNIKFRLDKYGKIKELNTLDELKAAIEDNPQNIYLIDDAKIIKKNLINQKLKFLNPKDGIEQEYLLDNGIGDISVDSIEELSKHIIKRLESLDLEDNASQIQDSIIEIVEDAYENSEDSDCVQLDDELKALLSNEDGQTVEKICDHKLLAKMEEIRNKHKLTSKNDNTENSSSELDAELHALLYGEMPTSNEDIQEEDENLSNLDEDLENLLSHEEKDNSEDSFDELTSLLDSIDEQERNNDTSLNSQDLSFDEDLANIMNNIEDTTNTDNKEELVSNTVENFETKEVSQGDNMADEFSEFDTLNEADLLAALNEIDNSNVSTPIESAKKPVATNPVPVKMSENINILGSNINDIAELISKLLNNKTLEITIKVKD